MQTIEFIDLKTQQKRLGSRIEEAIQRVLDHGHYIMGPEIYALEKNLATFTGAKHVLTCSNGTDALLLCLMAKGIQQNDAVLVPSFTFAATAEVVAHLGAIPIFVDVLPDSFNIDPNSVREGIETAKKLGLSAKALIVVDLFGQPADYDQLQIICKEHDLWLLADAAQSFGAHYHKQKVGTLGLCTATSFYPAKPLGCYGDGGAVFTDDDTLAQIMKSLRVHGEGLHKYDNLRVGMNGRLDTLQAAILIEKLAIFEEEIFARQKVAAYYSEHLKDIVETPKVLPGRTSVWAQYTIKLPKGKRDQLQKALSAQGIPTVVYYPKPLHSQPAYAKYPKATERLKVSENLAEGVLSLPMHPYLEVGKQDKIVQAIRENLR